MTKRHSLTLVLISCSITAVASAGVATAVARTTTVHTCVSKSSGLVRVAKKCKSSEHALVLGQTGPQGPRGAPGSPGPKGDTGPAGPLLTTLPAGTTVYGIAGVDVQNAGPGTGEISLPYPFTAEPNVAVVQYHGTDLHCTGTPDAPTAPSGYLCFYVESQSAVSGSVLMYGYDGLPGHSTKRGAVVAAGFTGAGYMFGTWAATG